MSPSERSVVERKLDSIRTNLADVETILAKGEDSYVKSPLDRKIVERSLHLVIEAAIDINLHILKDERRKIPEDSAQSFEMMGQEGFLPLDLAQAMAPSVGLRNRLVHEYDVLDARKVFAGGKRALDQFPQYVAAILNTI